jgi:Domain of unknown function (DUF4282)
VSQDQSFIQGLLDFSFTTFITQKLIKVMYGLGMVLLGLWALVFIFGGFATGFTAGITTLVLAPIALIAAVIVLRIYLEIAIVLFRIADHTSQIASASKAGQGGSSHAPTS